MSLPEVHILQENEVVALSDELARSAGFVGLDPWTTFVRKVYKFPVYRITTGTKDQPNGWLALVHVKHPIFGNYLTTSPFGSYGGFAYASTSARDVLLEQAQMLTKDLGVEYVNVRFDAGNAASPAGWVQHPIYSTYHVELAPDVEGLLGKFGSDHRNHIRKSLKKGFSIKFGHLDLLEDAYAALAQSMHELGSPYHHKNYLRCMAESLGDALEFAVAYNAHSELAGAGVFISQNEMVTNLHANILRRFRSDYAGEFLYWSVMQRYSQKGFKIFDLGRSLNGSGNETFKMKWCPRKVPLAYWYYLPKGGPLPELNQKSPKFRFAIWMWKRLPGFVVRMLGPSLISGLA
jgi:FemAB-related protein (PEP-CTERM system-associated)